MLIQIHMIQNHSPANLNRDDLGAPKTCFFGGVLRSRISSQCIKRSTRTSDYFRSLRGGIRTRQLAKLISGHIEGNGKIKKKALDVLKKCGIKTKDKESERSDMLVYTTEEAIREMASLLKDGTDESIDELKPKFEELISKKTAVPDMALSGRMLETGSLKDTTVEAALQVAHAISTHEARPEVDYFVAADDIPGDDAGAGYVDEAMFSSACFYKYFSISWETLLENLKGFGEGYRKLAAHTVGAFIKAAALTHPTGKQNSFAAHNPPDGILVEVRQTPISYANAFAAPVSIDSRDLISQSIAQFSQYVHDIDTGYGPPEGENRLWFSPNQRYPLSVIEGNEEVPIPAERVRSLEELIPRVISTIDPDLNWEDVQEVVITPKEEKS